MVRLVFSVGVLLAASFVAAKDGTCPADTPVNIKAPHPNIWAPLSQQETLDVEKWLYQQKDLNLTLFANATLSDNSIWLIEALMPNKSVALPYLDAHPPKKRSTGLDDRAGGGGAPARFARAVIFGGGYPTPFVQELQVGPLPISGETSCTPLGSLYQNSTIPGVDGDGKIAFNSRTTYSIEGAALDTFVVGFMTPLKDATDDLFGGSYTGSEDDELIYTWQGPNSYDGSWRRYWLWFAGKGNGAIYLNTVGFFVQVDASGTDASLWSVRKIVYNNQVFTSVDDFYNAWKSGTLKKGVKPDLKDSKWADRNHQGSERPLDDRATPRVTSFEGSRVKVDRQEQYVEWMLWSFYIGFNRDTGLTLWDIRFKGERIIYELSIQDAIAHYGGNDPVQSTTAYLDRHYGIGEETRQLLPGYDCPLGALTLNASYYSDSEFNIMPNAICIFEQDLQFPTSRHADTTNNWYGSTKGVALQVRTMAADNYDYLFSYLFYLEGTVEVLMGASGYLQATYWDPLQNDYGTRIQKTSMGSVHSHVINYKVDIDVLGTANSFQTINVVTEDVTLPWSDPEDGPTRQLKLQRSWVAEESGFNKTQNGQTVWLIGNKDKLNAWGYERMYRIMPGYHQAIQGAKILLNNARWSESDMYIVKQSDAEPSSSTTWNQQLPVTPPVDFSKFLDPPESIDQQDLVVYFNLGMHHVPRAEDTPNTLFTDTRSSFILAPFNYFDDEPSRDIRNAVVLQADPTTGVYTLVEGEDEPACEVKSPSGLLEAAVKGYVGIHTVEL